MYLLRIVSGSLPGKVIEVKKQEKELTFNERIASIAANASRCALQVHGKAERVYRVFWRIVRQQNSSRKAALPIIFSKEDLHKVIEATLAFFEEHGKPGERFGNTLTE